MKAVAAIILSNDSSQILLSKRSDKEENEVGKWENVGGKLNDNETFDQALKREVYEELGVDILDSEDSDFCIKVFKVKIKGEPIVNEPDYCDEIKWFNISNLDEIDLASYTLEDFKKLSWIKSK